jgi:hypothetical protein
VTIVAALASQAKVLKVRLLAAGDAAPAVAGPAPVFFDRIFAADAAGAAGSLSLAAGALGAGACRAEQRARESAAAAPPPPRRRSPPPHAPQCLPLARQLP